MNYRIWGRTGLKVSEIGLGGEWFNGLSQEESNAIVDAAVENGINYIDIFMPQDPTRDHLGVALKGRREKFIIQGICAPCTRTGSIPVRVISKKQGAPFRICWTACRPTTSTLA